MPFGQYYFMRAIGLREAKANVEHPHRESQRHEKLHDSSHRYSGVPGIPSDIGYHADKTTGGKKATGMSSNIMGNPAVVIGMGLTTAALIGMFRKSFIGDRDGAQQFMRYRIIAQFGTVLALLAGVAFFGATYEPRAERLEHHTHPSSS